MRKSTGVLFLVANLMWVMGCQRANEDLSGLDEAGGANIAEQASVDEGSAPESKPEALTFYESEFGLADDIREESDLCALRVNEAKLSATPLPLSADEAVSISGWAADKSTMSWPARPMLLLERGGSKPRLWQLDLPAEGTSRGDVERNFQLPGMRMTGFALSLMPSRIPDGNYRLHVAYASEGGLVICRRGGAVSVRRVS